MPLTPEQQALREAALGARRNATHWASEEWAEERFGNLAEGKFVSRCTPRAILALFAQIESLEARGSVMKLPEVDFPDAENSAQCLADQAQELGMGYSPKFDEAEFDADERKE